MPLASWLFQGSGRDRHPGDQKVNKVNQTRGGDRGDASVIGEAAGVGGGTLKPGLQGKRL